MKAILKKSFFLLIVLSSLSYVSPSQTIPAEKAIRIYNYPMNPRQHPDDARRFVKPPDANTFGNKIQFMALRNLDGDFKKSLDIYTQEYGLGNIICPSYPLIYRDDLSEVVQEINYPEAEPSRY